MAICQYHPLSTLVASCERFNYNFPMSGTIVETFKKLTIILLQARWLLLRSASAFKSYVHKTRWPPVKQDERWWDWWRPQLSGTLFRQRTRDERRRYCQFNQ
jgi:hypothetical protein